MALPKHVREYLETYLTFPENFLDEGSHAMMAHMIRRIAFTRPELLVEINQVFPEFAKTVSMCESSWKGKYQPYISLEPRRNAVFLNVPHTDGIFAPKEYELEGDTTECDIIIALGKAIKEDGSALASLKKQKGFESLWRDVEEIAAEAGESLND